MGEYMVGRLELTLDSKEIDYKNSSNLQGVIMENIDNEYADIYIRRDIIHIVSMYIQRIIRLSGVLIHWTKKHTIR